MNFIDFVFLVGLINKINPKSILEMGSGVTTCAITQYLASSNFKGKFFRLMIIKNGETQLSQLLIK